ncbi:MULTISPECIES: hypothetical protein [Photorhabdus]|uniref:Uncharacterized protein n=2 Tax=Photorhabdus asymbiotica TaxID=291112 RepID=B6VN62_PHOAA|nr:hypothetical protein [Photorhabdus asymbiotica]RKS56555.1 hypothetical protein BDD30_3157 [Photorhabdus asymbiotica]CAQ85070.1 conserved hypothetical protein [Photorhabdus asymbiotica]CAR67592.1 Hypothetical Protein PA-RVA15-17-1023 [Photorhabdus asymbiotica subsp. asymbiotica ATCC 43949]
MNKLFFPIIPLILSLQGVPYASAAQNYVHPIININTIMGKSQLVFYEASKNEGYEYCGGEGTGIIAKVITPKKEIIIDCYDFYKEMPKVLTVVLKKIPNSKYPQIFVLTSTFDSNAAIDGTLYQTHAYNTSKVNIPEIKLNSEFSCIDGYSYEENKKLTCDLKNANALNKLF